MASSSMASSCSCQRKHEVFLSFRGEDTRYNFMYYLYQALQRKGIGTYADFKELQRGDEISPSLLKAIEESMISAIIFSENFVASSWCLEEVSKIMECRGNKGQLVLPIFYHVNPSDIRKQTGNFGKDLAEHEKNRPIDKIEKWRHALTEAGNLSGWHLAGDRPEAIVIDEIVLDILNKLNRISSVEYEGLFGIGIPMEQIKSLLCIGGEGVRIVGITGMGGIGKTTLAEAIYNEAFMQFESHCFIANVREESEKFGIICLRNKLLSQLLDEENIFIGTPRIGSAFTKNRLRRKRVLVVLDDISDLDQLESLTVSHDFFGAGSRIIVTSRDKQVLRHGVDANAIYEVQELNSNASLQLFCKYAFKQLHPAVGFGRLSNRVLKYAEGIPIALKVLGAAFYQKCVEYWESALNKLKEYPEPKIHNLLKISFDGLGDIEKNIFLDIACFFKMYDRDHITKILDSCYDGGAYCGISNIADKCLLNIKEDNILWMHDLLQEMGQNIVRQESKKPGKRTRLRSPKDVYHVLKDNKGTKSIEGIFLDMSQIDEIQLHPDVFARMHNLKFIKFHYSINGKMELKLLLLHQDLRFLPGELRYFHWEDCPLKSLTSKFNAENLVELRLPNGNFEQLWDGFQNLGNLRVLHLRACQNLIRIPDLSKAINVEELDVDECRSLVELPSLTHLTSLKLFNAVFCYNLRKFPEVPYHISRLPLRGTAIEEVPSSINCLSKLSSLYMSETKVQNLPSAIVKMDAFIDISLSDCPNIVQFPNIPRNIQSLSLDNTPIAKVPSSINCLSKLTFLDMSGTKVQNLPSAIVKMDALEEIRLYDCPNIVKFPNIPRNIQVLNLDNTPIAEVPSSIKMLRNLSNLSLRNCTKLERLTTKICKLKCLHHLDLSGCSKLKRFPKIMETMENLIWLDLSRTAIKELPSPSDYLMQLERCRNMPVSSLSNLFSLEMLSLFGSKVEGIPSIKHLFNLTFLNLRSCKRLKSLPQLPPRLQQLDARDCKSLELVANTEQVQYAHKPCDFILFENCFSLDRDAAENIVDYALFKMQCLAEEMANRFHCRRSICCYPGNEISEKFEFQSTNSLITLKLRPDWYSSRFLGFALCVVVDFNNKHEHENVWINCFYKLTTKTGDFSSRSCWNWRDYGYTYDKPSHPKRNHVHLLFDDSMFKEDKHYEEASFEFFAGVDYNEHCCFSIKKCGVHVFYIPKMVKLKEIFSFGEEEMDLIDIHPSKSNPSFDNPTFEGHEDNPATKMDPQCSGSSSFEDEDKSVCKRLKRSPLV
ncbi:hypothetical protein DITRI_Ditri13aG0160500 [Diplodiscus trichospermus]